MVVNLFWVSPLIIIQGQYINIGCQCPRHITDTTMTIIGHDAGIGFASVFVFGVAEKERLGTLT
jgi:hypothetical protein